MNRETEEVKARIERAKHTTDGEHRDDKDKHF
jgi:hypothetical protein